jgi:hypothetical protein
MRRLRRIGIGWRDELKRDDEILHVREVVGLETGAAHSDVGEAGLRALPVGVDNRLAIVDQPELFCERHDVSCC